MQVESFLETSAAKWPEKPALVCGDRQTSFAELETAANRLATALVAEGVARGDRVAILLENGVEAVVAIFAVLKAGAVLMMVNPTTKGEKLNFVLNNSRASALVADARRLARVAPAVADTPHLKLVVPVPDAGPDRELAEKNLRGYDDLIEQYARCRRPPRKQAIDVDLAALVYTSGSSGNPKGVMLTHRNLVSVDTSIIAYLENTEDDVILSTLPLSFGYGLHQVLTAIKVGATVVLERSFTYPHAVLQQAVARRATGIPLVPTMAAILLQLDLSRYDLSRLRYITNAGAALPIEHVRKLRTLLPHVKLYSMYGQTECTRVTYLPPEQIDLRPDSVGRGMPNEEVYLVDEEGRRVGPGTVGQLVVRGANVMAGYWELPQQTERALRPGPLPGERVLYTGDLFRSDEEGFLYFVSRSDDIIKSRGEKVSPKEVENVLYQHPAVAEVAVVGVPDEILGQAVKAVVVPIPSSEVSPSDLLRHCKARLEDFMVPKIVEFRASLAKTGNGKIDKRQLQGTPA